MIPILEVDHHIKVMHIDKINFIKDMENSILG